MSGMHVVETSNALFLEERGESSSGGCSCAEYQLRTGSMAEFNTEECCEQAKIYNCQGREISPDGEGFVLDEVYLSTEK